MMMLNDGFNGFMAFGSKIKLSINVDTNAELSSPHWHWGEGDVVDHMGNH